MPTGPYRSVELGPDVVQSTIERPPSGHRAKKREKWYTVKLTAVSKFATAVVGRFPRKLGFILIGLRSTSS